MDLRTQKIYAALIAAGQQLLTEKPFEKVTVAELCQRAHTRRATFYKHFSDKYDFLTFLFASMRQDLLKKAAENFKQNSSASYSHAMINAGLAFAKDNKELLLSLDRSPVAHGLLMTMSDRFNQQSLENLSVKKQLPENMQDELTFLFLIGAFNRCISWWIYHQEAMSEKELKTKLYALCDRLLTKQS